MPKCKYCKEEVYMEPGGMLVESGDEGFATHEECYQQSGDDEGYIERLHKILEDEGIE